MNKFLMLVMLGLLGACARHDPAPTASMRMPFIAEAFFVLEFEHDANGNLVHAASYGPAFKEQDALQNELIQEGRARQYNPAGFSSQFTVQHVKFVGPLGPHGAVVSQPAARTPSGWVLFATDFSAGGQYIGAETLHGVTALSTCQHQARDIIDSNHDAIPDGASLLIYCVPVPPLPSDKTLPNGDSII